MPEQVFEIIARIMGVSTNEISEDSSPQTLSKWDSLRHMKLILALEETLEIQFLHSEISSMKDVRSILECIAVRKS